MLGYRRKSRKVINKVKWRFSNKKVVTLNSQETYRTFKLWLDQGYDKINVGGGIKELNGFINIDFQMCPTVQRQVVANILDLSFIPDNCISQVHSNHVIEHLTLDQLSSQIRAWHRVLRPDGLLSIRCPNALGAAYGFWFEPVIEGRREEFLRLGFPSDEDFSNPADRWVHRDFFALLHWFYGDSGSIVNEHNCIVTPTFLKELLVKESFCVLKMTEPEALNIGLVARKTGTGE